MGSAVVSRHSFCEMATAPATQSFFHAAFNASLFALDAVIDNRSARYADWGFFEEGTFTEWGDDFADLLALLRQLKT